MGKRKKVTSQTSARKRKSKDSSETAEKQRQKSTSSSSSVENDNKNGKKRTKRPTVRASSEVTIPSKVHGSWPPLRKDTISFFELIVDECSRSDPAEIRSKKKRIACQNYFNELKERLMQEVREINGPRKKMATYQDIRKETVALEADLKMNTEQIERLDEEIQKYESLLGDIEDEIMKLED